MLLSVTIYISFSGDINIAVSVRFISIAYIYGSVNNPIRFIYKNVTRKLELLLRLQPR